MMTYFTKLPGLLRIALLISIISVLYGCASGGVQNPYGEPIDDVNVISALEKGDVRLTCDTACSGKWGATRARAKSLYTYAAWKDLAITVSKVGFKGDLAYYYLGRSAEGLGYDDAARTYYKLALANDYKCDFLFNNCDGLDFPRDINAGLKRLSTPEKAAMHISASDSNTTDSTTNSLTTNEAQAKPAPQERPVAQAKPISQAKSYASKERALLLDDLQATIKVEYDEFKKLTNYRGADVDEGEDDMVFLRAWKSAKTSTTVFQIYVVHYYVDSRRHYSSAWDSDGARLDTTRIASDVISCPKDFIECIHSEDIGLNITRTYLEKHRYSGIRFKVGGTGGEAAFNFPGAHIDAFLKAVK